VAALFGCGGKKSCASLIAWRVGPIAETILELLRASCRRQIRFLQSVHISAHIIHAVLAEEALNSFVECMSGFVSGNGLSITLKLGLKRSIEHVQFSRPTVISRAVPACYWHFTSWYASGYDASDPDDRRMFNCLLAHQARGPHRFELTGRPAEPRRTTAPPPVTVRVSRRSQLTS
jgi:hypothetical protein